MIGIGNLRVAKALNSFLPFPFRCPFSVQFIWYFKLEVTQKLLHKLPSWPFCYLKVWNFDILQLILHDKKTSLQKTLFEAASCFFRVATSSLQLLLQNSYFFTLILWNMYFFIETLFFWKSTTILESNSFLALRKQGKIFH